MPSDVIQIRLDGWLMPVDVAAEAVSAAPMDRVDGLRQAADTGSLDPIDQRSLACALTRNEEPWDIRPPRTLRDGQDALVRREALRPSDSSPNTATSCSGADGNLLAGGEDGQRQRRHRTPGPALRSDAGARFAVIRLCGNLKPAF